MTFDPYHKWLGIPHEEQPANHYRLLGVKVFENDLDAISSAADRQAAHVRTFQTGKHSAESQRLLNEISAARVCLLTPEKKAVYDAGLHAQLTQRLSQLESQIQAAKSHKAKPKYDPATLGAVGAVLVAVVCAATFFLMKGSSRPVATDEITSVAEKKKAVEPPAPPAPVPVETKTSASGPSVPLPPKGLLTPTESRALAERLRTEKERQASESKAAVEVPTPEPAKPIREPEPAQVTAAVPPTTEESEPQVEQKMSPERVKAETAFERVYLSDLRPVKRHVNGPVEDVKNMRIHKTTPPHGIQGHPFSEGFSQISYRIPRCRSLSGSVGIASEHGNDRRRGGSVTPLTFHIEGDGKLLWKSRPLQKEDDTESFDVSVAGISLLDLYVDCPGNWGWAWAVWIDPVLTRQGKQIDAPIVGNWSWALGIPDVTFTRDGKCRTGGNTGHVGNWVVVDKEARQYKATWDTGSVDNLTVSQDGKTIHAVNGPSVWTCQRQDKRPARAAKSGGDDESSMTSQEKIESSAEPATKEDFARLATLLRKKLRGKVVYDPKTEQFVLTYDWTSRAQFQDFTTKAKLAFTKGRLVLQPGESMQHVVDFKEVTITGSVFIPQMKGTLIETTGGAAASLGGSYADTIYLRGGEGNNPSFVVPDSHKTRTPEQRKGLQPFQVAVTQNRLGFAYGNGTPSQIGKAVKEFHAGQVTIFSGDVGYAYGKVVFTGTMDEKWLKEFVEE